MKVGYLLIFFFSSRRRHTRSTRDWSSDVCSSDLQHGLLARVRDVEAVEARRLGRVDQPRQIGDTGPALGEVDQPIAQSQSLTPGLLLVQRGRKRCLDSLSDQADQEFALRHLSPGSP